MDEIRIGRRERRRRKTENKMEENKFKKTIENAEFSIKPHVSQSIGKLVRRDTYTVMNSKSDFNLVPVSDFVKNNENSRSSSDESKNLTYSIDKNSNNVSQCTYSIDKPQDKEIIRPVPAPRKWKTVNMEPEKLSSDTDRDITEIDLDDMRMKSPKSDLSSKPSPLSNKSENSETKSNLTKDTVVAPIPKPRKNVGNIQKTEDSHSEKLKLEILKSSVESLNSKTESLEEKISEKSKIDEEPPETESKELPLVSNLQNETKPDVPKKSGRRKKFGDLFDRKEGRKKSKFSSIIKLEKRKMPKISSILKDLKEEDSKETKPEVEEEEKIDFQIDSPHYKESAENGRIYVQGKNGFHVMEREEVLRNGNEDSEKNGNGGMMEDSTVKTAVLFQRFWSRLMIYFHGVLAGFGFSHAATVTAIMLHYGYEPRGFLTLYSCLSLKIHYVFYMLIALCIVSCFDRIDIGHMNLKHWQRAWRIPSMLIILFIYLISFVLTFANQKTEARFDAFPFGNETEIWEGYSQSDIQVKVLQWYHTVWTRDVLVLFAWLMISLTKFDDFLYLHINNMAKYAEVKGEERSLHKADYF